MTEDTGHVHTHDHAHAHAHEHEHDTDRAHEHDIDRAHDHDHDLGHPHLRLLPQEAPSDGAGAEAWMLRTLLLGALAMVAAAVVASWSDIERYLRMRRM
jgi:hypothetical protein